MAADPGPEGAAVAGGGVVRVFVVDDHAIMLATLCKLIDMHPDLTIVGAAHSAEEALARLATVTPDVVLVDLSLPGMSGNALVEHLRVTHPSLRALIVSGHDSSVYSEAARRAGAYGYVMKDDLHGIAQAVRTVARGEPYR